MICIFRGGIDSIGDIVKIENQIQTMTQIDIAQAKADLAKLLDLAIEGEEITIVRDNKPVAKISPVKRPLKRGSAKGKVWMSDDFDEPLEDFKEYM